MVRDAAELPASAAPHHEVARVIVEVIDRIETGDREALLAYRDTAPFAAKNHPTEDHILPLFVALGAGGEGKGRRVHSSYEYGILMMDCYAFG